MASSAAPFANHSHMSGSAVHSSIEGWNHSSLVGALAESSSSQESRPHEWHIKSNSVPGAALYPSPSPSLLSSLHSSCTSANTSAAASPAPQPATPRPKKKAASRRALKSPDHVPRPRNAFMIFRSAYCLDVKQSQVEHDHRMISKILGQVWQNLDPEKKEYYQQLAAEEKRVHSMMYPHYRFSPRQRTEKPKKRNVKRNGLTDKQRCEEVARLLLEGKGGDELKAEVDKFDLSTQVESRTPEEPPADFTTSVFDSRTWVSLAESSGSSSGSSSPSIVTPVSSSPFESPAVHSPLFPPSAAQTPAIRSPLEMPGVAQFEACSPLSPLRLSSLEAPASDLRTRSSSRNANLD
ncbi:hypothetical protein BD414DRAFT_548346 [Trametes punicea]|nr:hypothetical protein BD414DRAFT_548346 [Trametes punicea]